MQCPKFIDSTRECIKEIEFLPIDTFGYCTTEKFIECPFYIILENTGFICENVRSCPAFRNFQTVDFDEFVKTVNQYCLSENCVNCKRYQLKKSGLKVPLTLHPDGRHIADWDKANTKALDAGNSCG